MRRLILLFILIYSPQIICAPTSYVGLTEEDKQALSKKGLLKQNLSLPEANRLLKEIFKLRKYETVDLLKTQKNGQMHWEIRALQNRTVKDISIAGHKIFSRNEILTFLNIPINSVFTKQQVISAIEQVKNQYRGKGFFNVKIELNFENISDHDVHIKINIIEGPVCKIRSINFSTSEKIKNLLLKRAKSYRNADYTRDSSIKIKEDLQSILFKKRYFKARLLEPQLQFNSDKTEVDVVYRIESAYHVSIHINIEDQELKRPSIPDKKAYRRAPPNRADVIKSLSLKTVEDFGSLMTLSQRIKTFYESRGYPKVQVNASEKILHKNSEHHLFFNIKPGHLFYLKEIQVINTNREDSQEYVDILRSDSFYFSRVAEVYVKDNILKNMNKLITTLQSRGYLKVNVQSLVEKFDIENREVTVQVSINEGPLTRIRNINFEGNQQVTNKELLEVLKLTPGGPLNLSLLEEGFDVIEEYYLQKGFLDIKINNPNNVIKYYNNDTQADILFEIHEGPQIKVSNISVQGNQKTKSYVILRELAFQQGDILTQDLIKESRYRLQQTGLFSSIDITLPEAGSSLEERTVLVRVTEGNPGFLRFVVGVNTESYITLRSIVGFGYRNLWGTARGFNTNLELKYSDFNFLQYDIGVSYYEPFIFGSRTRGRIHFDHLRDVISYTQLLNNERFVRNQTSIHFLLEREMSKKITLFYSLWKLDIEERYGDQTGSIGQTSVIGSIGPGIELDYRNDPFNTTKGTYSTLNVDFADPLLGSRQSVRFLSFLGKFNLYTPLFSKLVLANSVTGGYITNLNRGISEIPQSRIFLLGGQSSIRGYSLNSIPRIANLVSEGDVLTILTDSYYYLLKSELRVPIFKALRGVVFHDGGGVNIAQRHQKPEYRSSVGLGLRISTPVGPVSIEYGIKLQRREGESVGRLHFSIGAF